MDDRHEDEEPALRPTDTDYLSTLAGKAEDLMEMANEPGSIKLSSVTSARVTLQAMNDLFHSAVMEARNAHHEHEKTRDQFEMHRSLLDTQSKRIQHLEDRADNLILIMERITR